MNVDGKRIWVSIDETTDVIGRFVANVIVGKLEKNGPGEIFLVNSERAEIQQIIQRFSNYLINR